MKNLAAATLLLFLIAHPSDLSSCGPFFSEAIFTQSQVPDHELEFFQGKFGILQRTLWRAYLAIAYRTLSGFPVSKAEGGSLKVAERWIPEARWIDPVKFWLEQRMKVPSAKPLEIQQYRTGADYQSFAGCGDDAFFTAAKTLTSTLRESPDEAKDWLAAQDEVFSNCSKKGTIPGPAAPGSSHRVVANRAYQIAAAHFYSNDWEEAKSWFLQIAADQSSPWHSTAPYLIARVDLRRDSYPTAITELRAILDDRKLSAIHAQTQQLLDYAEARNDPIGYMAACAKQLTAPHPPDLAHSLHDYTFLYDKYKDARMDKASKYQPVDLQVLATKDDLTGWIESFGTEAAVKHWELSHSLLWLVSALSYASGSLDSAPSLVEGALHVPPTSPAYASVRFQAVRILMEMKKEDRAREVLAEVTPWITEFPMSAQNAFRSEHLKLARTFEEFLKYAPRTLAAETYFENGPGFTPDAPKPPSLSFFDEDATAIFNEELPLSRWLDAARDAALSPILRTEIAQAGFVRAWLIRSVLLLDFARALKSLKPAYAEALDGDLNAASEQQEFAILFWALHHPELSPWLHSGFQRQTRDGHIDNFRNNWWCVEGSATWVPENELPKVNPNAPKPLFLSKAEAEHTTAEIRRLNRAPGAPAYLSSAVIAWARSYPDDPRLPEALALAVKSSRFGCTNAGSAKPVSEAFHILHQRFPESQWAKQTRYRFN